MLEGVEYFSRENNQLIKRVGGLTRSRVMVGIPMTGLLRAEWVFARYGQVIPCNWSQVDSIQWLDQCTPLDFLVADARNILVQNVIEHNFEWLFQIDHDVCIPPDTVIRMNERMIKSDIPMWSGLYFTKSMPSEPLIYRGRGTGYFANWSLGDEVWVDGIPSGLTMIHSSLLKVLWEESPEYQVADGRMVREVYKTPARVWFDAEQRSWFTETGTEDLELCSRIMKEGIFKKAGWDKYQDMEFPFLCDTSIFAKHITNDGIQYPAGGEEFEFRKSETSKIGTCTGE